MPNTITLRSTAELAMEEAASRRGYRLYDWDGNEIKPDPFGTSCAHNIAHRYAKIIRVDGDEQVVLACVACYRYQHNEPVFRPRSEYPGPLSELPCLRDGVPFATPEQAQKAFERARKQLVETYA